MDILHAEEQLAQRVVDMTLSVNSGNDQLPLQIQVQPLPQLQTQQQSQPQGQVPVSSIDDEVIVGNEYKTTFSFVPKIEFGDLATKVTVAVTVLVCFG